MNALHAKSKRVRKHLVQQKKLGHALGLNVGGVNLAITLESGATLEKTDPFQVLGKLLGLARFGSKRPKVDVQNDGQRARTLQIPPELNEAPALVVIHGGIRDALKQVRALANGLEKHLGVGSPLLFDSGVANGVV